MILRNQCFAWCVVLSVTAACAIAGAQGDAVSRQEKERKLIAVLQSDAAGGDKAITCKQLAVYGSPEAVPALAALLADEHLSSWARIALEAIPGPAADKALREATSKVNGMLLVGVINSIGVRRDAQAVDVLAGKLKDSNADVASAAAVALGHIGGEQAAKALEPYLTSAPDDVRSAVAEGCILCAERCLNEQKNAEAVRLYDAVRQAKVAKPRMLDATRGAILARGTAGVPMLIEQLKSQDKGQFRVGLRVARELGGREVTEALAAEMERLEAERRPALLLALADRHDAAVLPTVVKAAGNGSGQLRITAVGILERLGGVSSVPVLLEAAAGGDSGLSQAAVTALAKLPGADVDADLLARLPQATGRTRQALIDLAGKRQLEGALPAVMLSLEDADAGIRGAAVQTVGVLGSDKQAGDLVRLLQKTQSAGERADQEKALLTVSGRGGAKSVPHLLPLMQSSEVALRMIGLHALAIAGGADALAAVKSAINDRDEAVQDEAVRTLSTWPNNWPGDAGAAEPLLALAKTGRKPSHQVLGVRGYLQYVRGDAKLSDSERVARVGDVTALIKRPEEKRLAIAVVSVVPTGGALELLTTLAADPAVTEEACSATVSLAGKNLQALPKEPCRKALQMVAERSENNSTRKKAEELLKKIP